MHRVKDRLKKNVNRFASLKNHGKVASAVVLEVPISKKQKPIEIEDPIIPLEGEEKPESEAVVGDGESETELEELELDEEEINPFGDKWEQ